MGKLDRRERLGPDGLIGREKLRKGIEMMSEIRGVMSMMLMGGRIGVVIVVVMRIGERKLLVRIRRGSARRLMAATGDRGRMMMRMHRRHARVMQARRWRHPGKTLSKSTIRMMGRARRCARGKQSLRIKWTREMIGENRRIFAIAGRSGLSEIGVMSRRSRSWSSIRGTR